MTPHPENHGNASSLVGRKSERSQLEAVLERLRSGDGGAALLRGPAGIGKTRLVDEFAAVAGESGVDVLRTTGVEAESELTFCGLTDLASELSVTVGHLPGVQRRALEFALGSGASGEPVDRFSVFSAARGLFELAAAERGGLVVVVDDLQWLDEDSRAALFFVARRAQGHPLAFVFAERTGEGVPAEVPGARAIELDGLPATEADQLLRQHAPASSSDVRHTLIGSLGGNPLALLESASTLNAAQLAGRAPLPDWIPAGRQLESHFAAIVAEMPESASAALLVSAAADSTDAALLADALAETGLGLDALDTAISRGLLALDAGRLRWRHPYVRSAVYLAADPAARQVAHRSLATAAARANLHERQAWHLAAATTHPDDRVAELMYEVARNAQERGAQHAAFRALERACKLTQTQEKRPARLLEAAQLALRIGYSERATELATAAEQESGDPYLQAQVERVRAQAALGSGSPRAAYARLYALGCDWERRDPALAVTLLCDCVTFEMANGDRDSYLRAARRAMRAGRSAGPDSEALPSLLLGLGLLAMGRGNTAIELLDRNAYLAERPEVWSTAPELAGSLALGWVWIGRHEAAAEMLEAPIMRARETGELRTLCFPLIVRSGLNRRLGRLADARTDANEAVRVAEDIGEGALAANNLAYLACAEALLGDVDHCRAHATRALELVNDFGLDAVRPYAHHALGLLELSLGNSQEAVTQLARAPRAPLFSEPGLALWTGDLAEAHARAGDRAAAEELLAEIERDVRRTGRAHGHAVLARVRGMLAPDDEFDDWFARAERWHVKAGLPLQTARSRLCHGERLRRARRRVDARPKLDEALWAFTTVGAELWAERTRQELAATGRRKPTSDQSPWSLLTARETDVARAIVEGKTYKEAAQSLFLSPRTVEHHLRQAYRKLGVRSRSELTILLR